MKEAQTFIVDKWLGDGIEGAVYSTTDQMAVKICEPRKDKG